VIFIHVFDDLPKRNNGRLTVEQVARNCSGIALL